MIKYVLITPARNEEAFLEKTIDSVVAQTLLPERWIIVDDGSTDRTGEIAERRARQHPWLRVLRRPQHLDRNFAGKVHAFNAGLDLVRPLAYDVIGNLDADITFDSDYFSFLLSKFQLFPELGVAGTPFSEEGDTYDYRFSSTDHVSGACQMFRRDCFEAIGGYVPIPGGGIDWLAVTSARMKGWKTRTFTEKVCHHHRKMGTASSTTLAAWMKHGKKDYYLGGHPLWQTCRAIFQMTRKPYILGGMFLFIGYWWAFLCRVNRPVPTEVIIFHRGEQMRRLRSMLLRAPRLHA